LIFKAFAGFSALKKFFIPYLDIFYKTAFTPEIILFLLLSARTSERCVRLRTKEPITPQIRNKKGPGSVELVLSY